MYGVELNVELKDIQTQGEMMLIGKLLIYLLIYLTFFFPVTNKCYL